MSSVERRHDRYSACDGQKNLALFCGDDSEGFCAERAGRSMHGYVTERGDISTKGTGQGTKNLPGGFSAVVPPDPMPNSEVKRRSADGSVGSPHARVGNCRASYKKIQR